MTLPNSDRGKLYNVGLATQPRDFSGLRYGNITPTDIDGLVEFRNRFFVLFEAKRVGADLPEGQRIALERLCKAISKPCVVCVVEHATPVGDQIPMAESRVCRLFLNWKMTLRCPYKEGWNPITSQPTLKEVVDYFCEQFGLEVSDD